MVGAADGVFVGASVTGALVTGALVGATVMQSQTFLYDPGDQLVPDPVFQYLVPVLSLQPTGLVAEEILL